MQRITRLSRRVQVGIGLAVVAALVKKSVPWCSKRWACSIENLHWAAKSLIEDGITEDLELLKAYASLYQLLGYTATDIWNKKIRAGEAGRDEIRVALKQAKANRKAENEKAAARLAKQTEKISHAKPREPPPPPPWTIEDALEEIEIAIWPRYTKETRTAAEIFNSYTAEQQTKINTWAANWYNKGAEETALQEIAGFVHNGQYADNGPGDLGLIIMIAGAAGKEGGLIGFLELLQSPKKAE